MAFNPSWKIDARSKAASKRETKKRKLKFQRLLASAPEYPRNWQMAESIEICLQKGYELGNAHTTASQT